MKPIKMTSFVLTRVVGNSPGVTIHRYYTLAGAKSGLRALRRDLVTRRMPYGWLRLSRCFSTLSYQLRKQIASQLSIVKHVEIHTLVN